MTLKNDGSKWSYKGYKIDHYITQNFQSNGYNFGKETEVKFEIMTCLDCNNDCKTAYTIEEGKTEAKALFGICPKCEMEYFI